MSLDRILLGAIIATIIVTALGGFVEAVFPSPPNRATADYNVGANGSHEQAALAGMPKPRR